MCFGFLYTFYLNFFFRSTKKGTGCDHKRLHVNYPLFLSDFNNTSIFFRYIFEKYSNIKFHENPSSGGRVVPCGLTDRQTDTTEIIIAYRNFANAPTNSTKHNCCNPNVLSHFRSIRCCTAHYHSCLSFIAKPKVEIAQASTKEIPKYFV